MSYRDFGIIDERRADNLRNLAARRPDKALAKVNAQLRHAKTIAAKEHEQRTLHERRNKFMEEVNAEKDAHLQQKVAHHEGRVQRVNETQRQQRRYLEERMAHQVDKHAGVADMLKERRAEQTAQMMAISQEKEARSQAILHRAHSMDQHRRKMIRERREQVESRVDQFQDDLNKERARIAEEKQAREEHRNARLTEHQERLWRAREHQGEIYHSKLERVEMKQAAQQEIHAAIAQHSAAMEWKINELESLTAKHIATGTHNRRLEQQIGAVRRELEDLANSVPAAGTAGFGGTKQAWGLDSQLQATPSTAAESPYTDRDASGRFKMGRTHPGRTE
eukprot:CAMPEP_0206491386 /NCGR_PEP_ID=MMETSP0324_2-20121206/44958_1 /ASSEMBLY_ACC=CAM_ASM_000836 /TAXON_ID=2866 /ORGANISM="Crypthecodinium cohnii, Strain Seligo" /LENGTH=335 /DNA_ID=CAMNT_0053972553 /DNA_START=21 /DNA_END=1028 /DNA_ORIENTATION=+